MVSWEPWPLAGGGAATSEVGGAVSHKVTHPDPPSRRGHPLPRQAVNPGGVLAGQGAGAKAGLSPPGTEGRPRGASGEPQGRAAEPGGPGGTPRLGRRCRPGSGPHSAAKGGVLGCRACVSGCRRPRAPGCCSLDRGVGRGAPPSAPASPQGSLQQH